VLDRTKILIDAMIAAGMEPAFVATLVTNATMQWAAAPRVRSRHAEAQARYHAKKLASKGSDMISSDQNDQNDQSTKESPQTPKENTYPSLPVTSLRSVTAEPRKELFGRGAQWLSQVTGKPLNSTKTLIGRWLKIANDEAHRVLAAIDQAKESQICEPIAWVSASLNQSKPMKSREKINATLDRIDAAFSDNAAQGSRTLVAPANRPIPVNLQRSNGASNGGNGANIYSISGKLIEGDLQPPDGDAFQF